jgi:F-type H+-transporting ATPase subunit alpha
MILAGNRGYLDNIPVSAVNKFEAELMPFMEAKHSDILDSIREEKKITDETEAELIKALDDFSETFSA